MKIGIDIDGVLTDEHSFIIDNATKTFSENNIPYMVHKDIYDSAQIFEVTDEEYNFFWKTFLLDYSKNVSIRPYATEIINKLKNEKYEIIIITARSFTTYENQYKEQMQTIVKEWLEKNNIIYDDIVFTENKVNACKKLNINIMIEDKPENIISISKEIPVLCYDHPYNEKISNNNIYRCYSWYDIYEKIHMLSQNDKEL